MHGSLVTDIWLGDPADPPAESHADLQRAVVLVALTGILSAALVVVVLL